MTITYGSVRAHITDTPAAAGTQAVRLELPGKSTMSLQGTKQGVTVQCFQGTIWLTQSGDARDNILSPGEAFTLQGRGLAVLQAMQDAVVSISEKR